MTVLLVKIEESYNQNMSHSYTHITVKVRKGNIKKKITFKRNFKI